MIRSSKHSDYVPPSWDFFEGDEWLEKLLWWWDEPRIEPMVPPLITEFDKHRGHLYQQGWVWFPGMVNHHVSFRSRSETDVHVTLGRHRAPEGEATNIEFRNQGPISSNIMLHLISLVFPMGISGAVTTVELVEREKRAREQT